MFSDAEQEELRRMGGPFSVVDRACVVQGCPRPVVAHGLCRPHYDRKRRVGSPIGPSDVPLPICLAPGCGRTVDSHNARYCAAHVSRAALLNQEAGR